MRLGTRYFGLEALVLPHIALADLTVRASSTVASDLGFAASYVHPTPMQRDSKQGAITFDWGDGTTSYGGSPTGAGRGRATHTYAGPGVYTITGSVTDANGGTRPYRERVTIASR